MNIHEHQAKELLKKFGAPVLKGIVIFDVVEGLAKGKALNQLIQKDKLESIIDRTRKGGAEIGKLLQTASAFYAPAVSGIEMAESYIKDLKKTLPCAAHLNGEYGVKDLYAGVPVTIGNKGVEKIIEIDLSEDEKKQFNYSIDAVQKLFDAAKKIDGNLKK